MSLESENGQEKVIPIWPEFLQKKAPILDESAPEISIFQTMYAERFEAADSLLSKESRGFREQDKPWNIPTTREEDHLPFHRLMKHHAICAESYLESICRVCRFFL
ncbi:hypothetical protein SAY86_032057 [Trapa natans]|uniref:Uncharacterized protein n=1 Tax=Trapa natans TaxID=22666 RepID=A0AAN7R447_TRANT|nr:hypothetical protein SAY86_032057 [Trapa natans]